MTAATEVKTAVSGPGQEPAPAPAELFRYATWVHLGPGAEDCEALERDDGGEVVNADACGDRTHFHAWCRLPNPVQHEDIRTKALAAKARHVRLLRDEGSDEAVVLDSELDDLRLAGDTVKEAVVEEILAKTFWKSYIEATRDVQETIADDGETKVYEHVAEDQRRFQDLQRLSEEDRAGEQAEYEQLVKHLADYNDAVNERHEEIRAPERQALADRDLEDLLAILRSDRVQRAADKVFMATYSRWEWLTCTLTRPYDAKSKAQEGHRRFPDMEALSNAAPEVIEALEATFNDLEQTKNSGASGN
jgi:hypothetical protein